MKRNLVLILIVALGFFVWRMNWVNPEEKAAYDQMMQNMSLQSVKYYLDQYPQGRYLKEAYGLVDQWCQQQGLQQCKNDISSLFNAEHQIVKYLQQKEAP